MVFAILGAGRFGSLALARLASRRPQAEFWLVDRQRERLQALAASATGRQRYFLGDAVAWLTEFLLTAPPTWIIPAVPKHVAWGWLSRQLPAGSWQPAPVPPALVGSLPWVVQGQEGELYLSLAPGICPDDCPEALSRCPLTGKSRSLKLYQYLEDLSRPEALVLVVRSRQLAPGVGGFQPAALQSLLPQVVAARGTVYIATACRCHGVVHGLRKISG